MSMESREVDESAMEVMTIADLYGGLRGTLLQDIPASSDKYISERVDRATRLVSPGSTNMEVKVLYRFSSKG